MLRNKRGISLIVLVITIIVMIVLAAAIILALNNTGIISKANQAVDATDLNQVQHVASLVWAEAYLDNVENIEGYVVQKLAEQGIDNNKYDILVGDNGVSVIKRAESGVREYTVEGIPIPKGFAVSPYETEDEVDEGLVIYALTLDEIKTGVTAIPEKEAYQTSLETRNQFVWIPVDSNDFVNEFKRKDVINYIVPLTETETGVEKFWEIALTANNMVSQNTSTDNKVEFVSTETLKEATEMYLSVKRYGGFYIARYEVGVDSVITGRSYKNWPERVSIAEGTNSKLSVTMGKYPYNRVGCERFIGFNGESADGAIDLSRAFYPNDLTNEYGVVSTLTYGVQWDRIQNWWLELDENINLKNSFGYGVYKDTLLTSENVNANAKRSIDNSGYNSWESITDKTEERRMVANNGRV